MYNTVIYESGSAGSWKCLGIEVGVTTKMLKAVSKQGAQPPLDRGPLTNFGLKMATKVTFGADPEFFVARKEAPNTPIPACGLFGGAKKAPIFITPEGGYLEDGCALEFNVSPASTLIEVQKRLDRLITVFLTLNKDYVIYPSASAIFDPKELRKHPQATIIGCDADFWAYGIRVKPQASMFQNQRFAGGHIHLGLDPWPRDLDPKMLVKALDFFAFPYFAPQDIHRYKFYGHPGLYRETSYGVEWRSPDNHWAFPGSPTIAPIESIIIDLISDIDSLGGEKFNLEIQDFLNMVGIEGYLRQKNPSRLSIVKTRSQEYCSTWRKMVNNSPKNK